MPATAADLIAAQAEFAEKTAAAMVALQGKIDAQRVTPEEAEKVAAALLDAKLIDATQKEAAIKAASDIKELHNVFINLVGLYKQAAESGVQEVGKPTNTKQSSAASKPKVWVSEADEAFDRGVQKLAASRAIR